MFWAWKGFVSNENRHGKCVFIFCLTDLEGWVDIEGTHLGKGYSLDRYLKTDNSDIYVQGMESRTIQGLDYWTEVSAPGERDWELVRNVTE